MSDSRSGYVYLASLQIRMYAIYNRSKWILSILVISLTMTISAMAVIARIILQEQKGKSAHLIMK